MRDHGANPAMPPAFFGAASREGAAGCSEDISLCSRALTLCTVAFLAIAAHGDASIFRTVGDIAMQRVTRFLRSRQFALTLFCVLSSAAFLWALFASGALSAEEVAMVIFALYIGSKIFMVSAALWAAARHSAGLRRLLALAAGKLGFLPRSLDPRSGRRTIGA